MEQERRRCRGCPLWLPRNCWKLITDAMNAQVSELSLHGCYVDTLNPLPKGTSVYVKIFTEEYFSRLPRSCVLPSKLGMGLAFTT